MPTAKDTELRHFRQESTVSDSSVIDADDDEAIDNNSGGRPGSTAGRLVFSAGGVEQWVPLSGGDAIGTLLPGSAGMRRWVPSGGNDDLQESPEAEAVTGMVTDGGDDSALGEEARQAELGVEPRDERTSKLRQVADSGESSAISPRYEEEREKGEPTETREGQELETRNPTLDTFSSRPDPQSPESATPAVVLDTIKIPESDSRSEPTPMELQSTEQHRRVDGRVVSWADEAGGRKSGDDLMNESNTVSVKDAVSEEDIFSIVSSQGGEEEGDRDRRRVHSALQAVVAVEGWLDGMGGSREVEAADVEPKKSDGHDGRTEDPKAASSDGDALSSRASVSSRLDKGPRRPSSASFSSREEDRPLRIHSAPSRSTLRDGATALWKGLRVGSAGGGMSMGSKWNMAVHHGSTESIEDNAKNKSVRNADADRKQEMASQYKGTSEPQQPRRRSSITARMEALSVAEARSIAEAISIAAAQWDPSQRSTPTSSHATSHATSRAASRPSSPVRASVASCATAATGGRRTRPTSGRRRTPTDSPLPIKTAPARTGKELWAIARETFCPRNFDPLSLLRVSRPIPYVLTIRHGFQFKYALRHRQTLLCTCHHPKIPVHYADGRAGENDIDDKDEAVLGSKVMNHADASKSDSSYSLENKRKKDKGKAGAQQPNYLSYTFAAVDRTRIVSLWDVPRAGAIVNRPRAVVRMEETEVEQFVYLSRFCVYAGCSCDRGIKFFNSRFELTNLYHTFEPVIFIRYNSINHDLITAGSHHICIWTLEATRHPSGIQVHPTLKCQFNTALPRDQWISILYLDERNSRLFCVVDRSIFIFDHMHGTHVDTLRNISSRHVTAVLYHGFYQYTLIGCADGSVQIRNMNNALVHEFMSHTKPVTALALYPHGPMLMSCATDHTIRMYSLKSFKEVYCIHIRDNPLDLKIMDDQQLYIRTRDTIQVWNLNHINSVFASVNSRVQKVLRVKTPGRPSRIVARTEDGIIRLLSPVSGKPVTTALPLLETDYMHDLAYCAKIDRMYLMLDNGEVWVIATNFNPCIVVDIWKLSEAVREDCSHIAVFDGRFSDADDIPPGYDTSRGFALLLGATRNGQVLVYGKRGGVRDRYQLHNAEITQMICDQKQQLLITSGVDEMIKISTISPTSSELIQVKITIWTHSIPKMIAILDNTICAALEEWNIQMYSFNLNKNDWCMLAAHNRSDDHTEAVTALCPIRKLGLFVSTARDGTIRVWDTFNTLIRELQFQQPLESLCIANSRGDLVFGIQNRLDIIKYQSYLPPGYVQTVQKMPMKDDKAEPPIPFDDERTNWKALQYRAPRRIGISAQDQWQLFNDVNLVGTEKPTDAHLLQPSPPSTAEDEAMYLDLMRRLDILAVRRREIIKSARRRMEAERADQAREAEILHEEFRRYVKMKPFFGISREDLDLEEIAERLRPTSPEFERDEERLGLGRLLDIPRPETREGEERDIGGEVGGMVAAAEILAEYAQELQAQRLEAGSALEARHHDAIARNAERMGADEYSGLTAADEERGRRGKGEREALKLRRDEEPLSKLSRRRRVRRKSEEDSDELEDATKTFANGAIVLQRTKLPKPTPRKKPATDSIPRRLRSTSIAPDGILPNSLLRFQVDEWRKAHGGSAISDLAITPRARPKKEIPKQPEDQIRKKKSEEYKAKLKEMLANLPREEEVIEEVEEEMEVEEDEEEDEEDWPGAHRKRLPVAHRMRHGTLEPRVTVKEIVEVKMPIVVEKMMGYEWFPADQIFNPPDSTDGVSLNTMLGAASTTTGRPPPKTRTLKIDPDSTTLLPIILDIFRRSPSSKTRREILEYVNWMYEEHGISDVHSIVKLLARYLSGAEGVEREQKEEEVQQGWEWLKGGKEEESEWEVQLRCAMIETMARLAPNSVDVVPSLLVQSLSKHEAIRSRAIHFLKALGVHNPENNYLKEAVREIIRECTPKPTTPPPQTTKAWDPDRPEPSTPSIRSTSRPTSAQPKPTSRPQSARPGTQSRPPSARPPSRPPSAKPPSRPQSAQQTLPTPDLRTTLTTFLRTNLRKYLLRATTNKDMLKKLKGVNIHGLEVQKKGKDKDHGDEQEKEKGKGKETTKGGSRPGSAATKTLGEGGTKPLFDAGPGPKSDVEGGIRKKKVVFEGHGEESGGEKEAIKDVETTQEKGKEGESEASKAAGTVDKDKASTPITGILKHTNGTGKRSGDRMDIESITYRPSVPLEAEVSGQQIPFYQTLDIDRPSQHRSPISTLQNPTSQDYINALNFYILSQEHAAIKAEQERLAKIRAEQESVAAKAAEAEKRAKLLEYLARKEREKQERIEARARKLEEMRRKREEEAAKAVEAVLPGLRERKRKGSKGIGMGLTHKSVCHPSRETLDYEYRAFPPISTSPTPRHAHHRAHYTPISMHIRKYNRSMPIEHVDLVPFDPFSQESQPRRPTRIFSAARPPSSIPGSLLAPSELVPTWRQFSLDESHQAIIERELMGVVPGGELRYIRSTMEGERRRVEERESGQGEENMFRTQKKYFIPALSVAVGTVAAGQTYGLTD